jgi:hypothetical protein
MQLRVRLSDALDAAESTSELELGWKIVDEPIGAIWFRLAQRLLASSVPILPRLSGFSHGPTTRAEIERHLNWCIDSINELSSHRIEERAGREFTQQFANAIHHHFEQLAGPADNPSAVVRDAGPRLWNAIYGLNHCIHDLESLSKSQEALARGESDQHVFSSFILEAPDAERFFLSEELQPQFSLDIDFGDLVLHYAQVGKTWWEVFLDSDQEIFPEAILPLNVLTGEFDAFFGTYSMTPERIAELERFLIEQGQQPSDPALRLGFCRIGRLIRRPDMTNVEYKKQIGRHGYIREIRLIDDQGRTSAVRNIQPDCFMHRRSVAD